MKTFTKILFNLTLAGLLAAGLTACAPATDPAPATKTTTPTALLSLTFKADADGFVSSASWAADSLDKTKGEQTINVYGGDHSYTPAAVVDLSKAKSLSVDVKGNVKTTVDNSSWWFSGFRIVLVDSAGKKFDFVDIKDTTDFNDTAFTTVKRTVADGVWENGAGGTPDTGDLAKIAKITIYSNYNAGSLVLKNLIIE